MKLTTLILAASLLISGCYTSGTYNGSSYSDRTRVVSYAAPDYSLGKLETTKREHYPVPTVTFKHEKGTVIYTKSGNSYTRIIIRNK